MVIEQKLLESDHSYMEVDSMHSATEKAQKYVPVYTMHDWLTVFRTARTSRSNKKPYNVQEIKFTDILDLEQLSKALVKSKMLQVFKNINKITLQNLRNFCTGKRKGSSCKYNRH